MKSKVLLITFLTVIFGLAIKPAWANYQYGGEEPTSQIIVDKQVKPNIWSNWYDNISAGAFSFVASDKVDYKIIVKNSGDKELKKVKVTDNLPDFVSFVSGTDGYSVDGQKVKWEIETLSAGEQKEFQIEAKVSNSEQLKNKNNFCVTNQVRVEAETGEADEDTAQICIESRVLGAEALPEAGVNLALVAAAGLAISAFGTLLRKIS